MAASVLSANTVVPGQSVGAGYEPLTLCFGPYTSNAQADHILPFVSDKAVIIDKVHLYATTKPSVGSNFTIYRGASGDTDVAGIISAGLDVTATKDLNTLTNFTRFDATVQSDNNLLLAGDVLVADFGADTSNMAGFFIVVKGRRKL